MYKISRKGLGEQNGVKVYVHIWYKENNGWIRDFFFFFASARVWWFGDWLVSVCVYYIPAGRGGGALGGD